MSRARKPKRAKQQQPNRPICRRCWNYGAEMIPVIMSADGHCPRCGSGALPLAPDPTAQHAAPLYPPPMVQE